MALRYALSFLGVVDGECWWEPLLRGCSGIMVYVILNGFESCFLVRWMEMECDLEGYFIETARWYCGYLAQSHIFSADFCPDFLTDTASFTLTTMCCTQNPVCCIYYLTWSKSF